ATSDLVTSTSAFTRVGIKLDPTILNGATSVKIRAKGNGSAGSKIFYVDSVRMLEVRKEDNDLTVANLLLKFPYFSLNYLGTDGDCEDYTKYTAYSGSTLANYSTDKVFGTSSISATNSTNDAMGLTKSIVLNSAKSFLISAYVKGTVDGKALSLVVTDASASTVKSDTTTYTTKTNWTRVAMKVSASNFTSKNNTSHTLRISATDTNRTSTIYIDGVCIREISAEEYSLPTSTLLNRYPFHSYEYEYAGYGNFGVKVRGANPYVNLLGTAGDCETLTGWSAISNATNTLDSSKQVAGTYGIKTVHNSQGYAGITRSVTSLINSSKYYMASCYVKTDGTASTGISILMSDNAYSVIKTSSQVKPTAFQRICMKIQPSDFSGKDTSLIRLQVQSVDTNQSATSYVDGIMINEITAEEYNNLSTDQLMLKYAYINTLRYTDK
ncbi:hypothetical protein EBX93_16920, partial [bacterium]|nr:hypothetical protein [bacterium]